MVAIFFFSTVKRNISLSNYVNESHPNTNPIISSKVSIPTEPSTTIGFIRIDTLEKSVSGVHDNMTQIEEIEQKEEEIATIDKFHTIIHKSNLKLLERKAEKYNSILRQLTGGAYQGTPLGDAMIGFASSLVPQCGYAGVATILPILIASVFANAGIEIDSKKLVNSQPSDKSIQRFVENNALNTFQLTKESIKANPNIYIYI